MKRIALKIDVDTLYGTRIGIPALIKQLDQHQAQATFFLSLGPDRSGCQPRITSLKRFYNLKTRLYGRLLPPPEIGKRGREVFAQLQSSGHEIGLHAWNRVAWEENISSATPDWVEAEMKRADARFEALFAVRPNACAAAGWKSCRQALRLTQRMDYQYASDCRGNHPFIPVVDGEIVTCPQLPTTLPTLDEVLILDPDLSADAAADRILRLSQAIPGDHVFTLRAELEGIAFASAFEKLLSGWKNAGYALVALRDMRAELDIGELPRHTIEFAEIPGRPGLRMTQGPAFPLEG